MLAGMYQFILGLPKVEADFHVDIDDRAARWNSSLSLDSKNVFIYKAQYYDELGYKTLHLKVSEAVEFEADKIGLLQVDLGSRFSLNSDLETFLVASFACESTTIEVDGEKLQRDKWNFIFNFNGEKLAETEISSKGVSGSLNGIPFEGRFDAAENSLRIKSENLKANFLFSDLKFELESDFISVSVDLDDWRKNGIAEFSLPGDFGRLRFKRNALQVASESINCEFDFGENFNYARIAFDAFVFSKSINGRLNYDLSVNAVEFEATCDESKTRIAFNAEAENVFEAEFANYAVLIKKTSAAEFEAVVKTPKRQWRELKAVVEIKDRNSASATVYKNGDVFSAFSFWASSSKVAFTWRMNENLWAEFEGAFDGNRFNVLIKSGFPSIRKLEAEFHFRSYQQINFKVNLNDSKKFVYEYEFIYVSAAEFRSKSTMENTFDFIPFSSSESRWTLTKEPFINFEYESRVEGNVQVSASLETLKNGVNIAWRIPRLRHDHRLEHRRSADRLKHEIVLFSQHKKALEVDFQRDGAFKKAKLTLTFDSRSQEFAFRRTFSSSSGVHTADLRARGAFFNFEFNNRYSYLHFVASIQIL